MSDPHFEYSALRGRIVEIFGTQEKFASALKMSTAALNNKLNGRSEFKTSEMLNSLELLQVERTQENLVRYFFTIKS